MQDLCQPRWEGSAHLALLELSKAQDSVLYTYRKTSLDRKVSGTFRTRRGKITDSFFLFLSRVEKSVCIF